MANQAKALATAVAGTGTQAGVDLIGAATPTWLPALPSHITCVVSVAGATPDNSVVCEFDGSLDGATWFSLGQKIGPGVFSNDGDAVQWVRASIIRQAAGSTCTVYCGFAP